MAQNELVNDIKTVIDISSRVDERVKSIQLNQQELNVRLNQFVSEFNQLSSRVSVLESKNGGHLQENISELRTKIERIDVGGTHSSEKEAEKVEEIENKLLDLRTRLNLVENINDNWQNKFKQYSGLTIQGIWVIIVCYILFKLGLSTSPLP